MSSDRELLELAAKAAGMKVAPLDRQWGPPDEGAWFYNENGGGGMFSIDARPMRWNPLTDDRDALRLAVKCCISIDFTNASAGDAWACGPDLEGVNETHVIPEIAARRAIVRAAASLAAGRSEG